MNTCKNPNCNKSLEHHGPKARWCSERCRSEFRRNNKKQLKGITMDTKFQPPTQQVSSSWEQYALRKAEEENKELKAQVQLLQKESKEKDSRIIELEKEEIRKESELAKWKKEDEGEGSGLSGLGNPETLDKITQLAGMVLPLLQGGTKPVQQPAALEGIDLQHQTKAVEYAKFLSELKANEVESMHGLLTNIAYVFKNVDKTILNNLLNQLQNQIYNEPRKQAGQF